MPTGSISNVQSTQGQAQAGIQKAVEKEEEVRAQMKERIRTCGAGAEGKPLSFDLEENGNVQSKTRSFP